MFEFQEDLSASAKIKVVGIGGGGGNAIKTMMRAQLEGVDFVVVNTDVQSLKQNDAPVKIQVGNKLTKGLGAGSNPAIGRDAALEDVSMIQEALSDTDMIFVTAGMGGGTGTGAAPVVAKVAKEMGILTVGVVTKPFSFEGKKRAKRADEGILDLKNHVDTLICIPNDNLLNLVDKDTPIIDSFKMADHVLLQAVRGISDVITIPGLINLDFADVKTVMKDAGVAMMGTGICNGENRALQAARMAISSPLLENISIAGATGILLNITGSSDMTLFEVNEACKLIQQEADDDVNIIFGSVIDDTVEGNVSVTVIATGFDHEIRQVAEPVIEKSSAKISHGREQKRWLDIDPQSIRDVFDDQKQEESSHVEIQETSQKLVENTSSQVVTTEPQPDLFAAPQKPDNQEVLPPEASVAEIPEQPASFGLKKSTTVWGEAPQEPGQRDLSPKATRSWKSEKSSAGKIEHKVSRNQQDMAELKKTIQEVGIPSLDDDQYDIPAFIRRRAD